MPLAAGNLREEAMRRGVDGRTTDLCGPNGLIGRALGASEKSQRTLFLDTFPYNAHAIGDGRSVGGCAAADVCGESFASRVAASLLVLRGCPNSSPHAGGVRGEGRWHWPWIRFELGEARRKLAQRASPLFDTQR